MEDGLSQQAQGIRQPSRLHFPALDGLRGVAILFVILYHFHFLLGKSTPLTYAIYRALNFGWCGVDLFFVLSGFLITGILLDAKGKPDFFRSFYIRRVLRIFPLYYCYLAFVLVVFYAASPWLRPVGEWAGWYIAYLSNWKPDHGENDQYLRQLWSLAVEEQFYLVWPFLIAFTSKRYLPLICGALIIGAPILRFVLIGQGASAETAYRLTVTRMDALAMGALLAWCLRSKYWPLLERNVMWVLGVALLATAVFCFLDKGVEWAGLMVTWGDSAVLLLFASFVTAGVAKLPLAIPFTAAWIRSVGKYSYAMYLFQEIVARRIILQFNNYSVVTKLFVIVAATLAVYLAAVLSWRLFESPILRLKDRWAPRPTAGPDDSVDAQLPLQVR